MKKAKHLSKFEYFTIIYAAVFLAAFAITGITPFVFIAMIDIVLGNIFILSSKLKSKHSKNTSLSAQIGAIIILSMFYLLTPPITLHTNTLWKYNIQRTYVGLYRNIREPEWFPDFEKDVKDSFRFDYFPSLMQGTGHFSVVFRTDNAQNYSDMFKDKAIYTIPMSEWSDPYKVREGNGYDNMLSVYVDDEIKSSDSAVIYVLDAVTNFNHPHSSAVIVDTQTGYIQLSQLG